MPSLLEVGADAGAERRRRARHLQTIERVQRQRQRREAAAGAHGIGDWLARRWPESARGQARHEAHEDLIDDHDLQRHAADARGEVGAEALERREAVLADGLGDDVEDGERHEAHDPAEHDLGRAVQRRHELLDGGGARALPLAQRPHGEPEQQREQHDRQHEVVDERLQEVRRHVAGERL